MTKKQTPESCPAYDNLPAEEKKIIDTFVEKVDAAIGELMTNPALPARQKVNALYAASMATIDQLVSQVPSIMPMVVSGLLRLIEQHGGSEFSVTRLDSPISDGGESVH